MQDFPLTFKKYVQASRHIILDACILFLKKKKNQGSMSDFFPVLLNLICSPHQNINILNLVLQEFVLELRYLGSYSVNTQTASGGYTVNRIASIEPVYKQNSETLWLY